MNSRSTLCNLLLTSNFANIPMNTIMPILSQIAEEAYYAEVASHGQANSNYKNFNTQKLEEKIY